MAENKEEKKQIKGLLYEEGVVNQVLAILNNIPVTGMANINGMKFVLDSLSNPIPFEGTLKETK